MIALPESGLASFSGGIHPAGNKSITAGSGIEVLPIPASVRIPLLQHLGSPGTICVKPRSTVSMGDRIADAGGFISATAHASVNGQIARLGMATLPNGRHIQTIPIKSDEDQPFEGKALYDHIIGGDWSISDIDAIEPESISKAAQEGGLVGLGGAAFPTHVKLLRNKEKPIEYLLLNGCECEPYLTADYRLMLESPDSIIAGARLAQRANGARQAIICVEDNKRDAAEALVKAAEGTGVKIRLFKTKYPQGGEKQLTVAALGREVPTGGLPLDVGVVVLNVGTAASLARMVLRNIPLTHRIVTVTGRGIRQGKNILAPIGTPYRELIDFCGGMTAEATRVIAGGPMMGFTLGDLETPITKGTSGITVLTDAELRKSEETACVRCGRCVDVCPLNLVPTKIALACRMGNVEVAERYYLTACMECGCCAYHCPASIPLVQLIRTGKILAMEKPRRI